MISPKRWLLPAATLATVIAVALFIVVTVVRPGESTASGRAALNSAARSVRVVQLTTADGTVSPGGNQLSAVLLSGAMPHGTVAGTVTSDANCEPDAAGISHCLNGIRLADGSTITVRHNHSMVSVPCLSPGEMVDVRGA